MRPVNNSTSPAVDTGFQSWKSPVPYLFIGLALMLGLIAVALLILACSYRKSWSGSPSDAEGKPGKQVDMGVDSEPKIVVIMAGEDNPTHFAKPVAVASQTGQV